MTNRRFLVKETRYIYTLYEVNALNAESAFALVRDGKAPYFEGNPVSGDDITREIVDPMFGRNRERKKIKS